MLNLHLQGGEINQMWSDFVTFSPNNKFVLTKMQAERKNVKMNHIKKTKKTKKQRPVCESWPLVL